MKKIKVGIKNNPYEVNVGSDLLNKKNLKDLKGKEVLVVIDNNIPPKYKNSVTSELAKLCNKFHTLEIHASEENKNGITLDKIKDQRMDEIEESENQKPLPIETSGPALSSVAEQTDTNGYEWITHSDGSKWYRISKSGDSWTKFE